MWDRSSFEILWQDIGHALTILMQSLLYGVRSGDPIIFFGVAAILLMVAFLAILFPAWRAISLDPVAPSAAINSYARSAVFANGFGNPIAYCGLRTNLQRNKANACSVNSR
jgi:hypothetical protein